MKKILLASVAAIAAAPAAFADNSATINAALDAINQAYVDFGATGTSAAVDAHMAELLRLKDNHGAVETVTAGAVTVVNGQVTVADSVVTFFDNTADINAEITALGRDISNDFYGDFTYDESSWSVGRDAGGVYQVTGVSQGLVYNTLTGAGGLVADLNTMDAAISAGNTGLWDATNIGTLNSASDAVREEANYISVASTNLVNIHDETYATNFDYRTGTEGMVTIEDSVDSDGNSLTMVLTEQAASFYTDLVANRVHVTRTIPQLD